MPCVLLINTTNQSIYCKNYIMVELNKEYFEKPYYFFLKDKGNTIIPLTIFLSSKGWVKIEIACAKGKKLHDKRHDLKEKQDKIEIGRRLKA